MAVAIYAALRVISKHLATEVIALIGIVSAVVTIASLVIAHEDAAHSRPANVDTKRSR